MAKYRILLADSNNQFQTTVRDYLTAQEGIERVDTVNDGQSALDAIFTVLPIYVDLTFSLLRCCYLLNPALLPTDNFLFISALHFSDKY